MLRNSILDCHGNLRSLVKQLGGYNYTSRSLQELLFVVS